MSPELNAGITGIFKAIGNFDDSSDGRTLADAVLIHTAPLDRTELIHLVIAMAGGMVAATEPIA
jgi:hypothetical protein